MPELAPVPVPVVPVAAPFVPVVPVVPVEPFIELELLGIPPVPFAFVDAPFVLVFEFVVGPFIAPFVPLVVVFVVGAPLVAFAPFVVVVVVDAAPPDPPTAELAALLLPLPVGPCAPDVSVVPVLFVVAPPPPELSLPDVVVVVVVVLPPVFVAAPFAAYGSAAEPAFCPLRHATIINKTMTIATPATSA